MRFHKPGWLLALLCLVVATPASAGFRTTVTKADGFSPGDIERVAVVTRQCHEIMDCAKVEQKVFLEVKTGNLDVEVIPEQLIRKFLFSSGHTRYDSSLRGELAEHFGLDGVLELDIPHAEKGDGYGGRRGSQVKVELVLVSAAGEILAHGVGTGRPNNVVTSPERVAGNVVERLVKEIFQ